MSIRTLKLALRHDPANGRAIAYHTAQQNAAYNHAVDTLNREPNLSKRSSRDSPDALNKCITTWRQNEEKNRVRHAPTTSTSRAPRTPQRIPKPMPTQNQPLRW